MDEAIRFINDVGFPIATAGALLYFVQHLLNRIINNMEAKIDVLDEKLGAIINTTEERLSSKLETQHSIIVSLIDRVRSLDNEVLRISVLLKVINRLPETLEVDRLDKAKIKNQRKD